MCIQYISGNVVVYLCIQQELLYSQYWHQILPYFCLGVGWQCTMPATKASQVLGCLHWNIARDRDRIIPICSVLFRLHLEYCMKFWAPQLKKVQKDWRESKKVMKMIKGLRNLPWGNTEGALPLLPGEKTAHGDHITLFRYLKDGYKEKGRSLHKWAHGEGMTQWDLHWERFHTDIRKKLFTVRTTNHWNNLPKFVVKFALLKAFMVSLDRVPDNLIQIPFPTNIGPGDSLKSLPMDCFVIPWSHGTRETLNRQKNFV